MAERVGPARTRDRLPAGAVAGGHAGLLRTSGAGGSVSSSPSLPYSEQGRSWDAREALQRVVDDLFATFDADGPLTVTLTGTLADGNEVAVEYSAHGTVRGGRVYNNDYVMRVSIGADGLITRMVPYNDTRLLWRLMMEDLDD